MQDIFDLSNGVSPNKQDFIWLGSYFDGSYLSEFDFKTGEPNSFYDIQQDRLIKFGLIGHEIKMFFDASGSFNIHNKMVDLVYTDKIRAYPLTGPDKKGINNLKIITYKQATSSVDPMSKGKVFNEIEGYAFGYETKVKFNTLVFGLKVVVTIPYKQPVFLSVRLSTNQNLDGQFNIIRNGRVALSTPAPVDKKNSGEISWIVR